MKTNIKRILTLALFGLGLSGFFGLVKTTATYADEKPAEKPKVQIQISPVKNTVYLKGGDVSDFTFNVSNIGTEPFDFKVYATPYSIVLKLLAGLPFRMLPEITCLMSPTRCSQTKPRW